MNEQWKQCLPGYEVSDQGRVRRSDPGRKTWAGRILKSQVQVIGYESVRPTVDGKNKHFYVHDLVAAAFIGPKPDGASVNHKNGVKRDNFPANLEYVSHAENMKHAAEAGLMAHGEGHGASRLTEEDVAGIRRDRLDGLSYSQIARKRAIAISHAWQIVQGNSWRHSA